MSRPKNRALPKRTAAIFKSPLGIAPARRPFTVIVEGNIGSGKTTFLQYFNKFSDVCVLAEPIELWRDCMGYNLLGNMYKDPKQWCFTFQSYVQLTMVQQHTLKTRQPVKLMERSLFSARYCFVEKMARDGVFPPASLAVLDEWFKWINQTCDIPIDLIVYLRTTPEVVYERIMKRNRSEEKSVPLEYIKELHKIHEDWLFYKNSFHCPAPVLNIDANLDKSLIIEEYEKWMPHILNRSPEFEAIV